MSEHPIARQFLHSCYVDRLPDKTDAVVVSEYAHYADGRVVPEISIIKQPKRSFYITKPQYRDHTEKKEREHIDKLDKYTVYNYEMDREIFKALNGYYPKTYVAQKELFESPYLYGADIHIETLIKYFYKKKFSEVQTELQKKRETAPEADRQAIPKITAIPATTGFFDIERSVLPGSLDTITHISLTHENKVYTAILQNAFFDQDPSGNKTPGNLEKLKLLSAEILTPMIQTVLQTNKGLKRHQNTTFEFYYFVGQTELDLIAWIFARIHENRTSFLGVWNLDFDIPAILAAIKNGGAKEEDIFCSPTIPELYRKVFYKHDEKKVQSLTDKWHWLYCTAYGQFYDAMILYAKLRTVIGKEPSYALDDILNKNGLGGKLHFHDLPDLAHLSKTDWHRRMQSTYPYHYVVYSQWDVISLQLMEWKNADASSMVILSESTSLAKYTRQTRKAADTLYVNWLEKGWVLGTASSNMRSPYDDDIGAIGGAVLSPSRLDYNGLNALIEAPYHKTQLHVYVNDVDFSGMYPTVTQASNIAKETKLSTVLYITSPVVQQHFTPKSAVEAFFGYVIHTEANAVFLAQEFFGLPGFAEMLQKFERHHQLSRAA